MDLVSQELAAAAAASGSLGVGSGGGHSTVPPALAAAALNSYAAVKSGGGHGAPPPAVASTASPIPGVHTSTKEYMFGSEKARALNTYVLMKYGSKQVDN